MARSPSREFLASWPGCGGGINARASQAMLKPNQLIAGVNVILDEEGGAQKRLGCANRGDVGDTGRVISIYTFYRGTNAAPHLIVQTTEGKLWYTHEPNVGEIEWVQMASGLSVEAVITFETFYNKVYMTNGVDPYASWDGYTYVTYPSAPKARYIRLWKDTMWLYGATGSDDRLYSSAPGDAETWPVSSWVDVSKGDGDIGMAVHTDGMSLILWKRRRTFSVYDPVSFANRLVDWEKGCESHQSVILVESSIYFLSRLGICQYLGDAPSKTISGNVDPVFTTQVLNFSALTSAWAYEHQGRIGWALPEIGQSRPTMQLEFYPRLPGGPWCFQRMPLTCFARFRKGAIDSLLGGCANDNCVLEAFAEVGADNGVAFQSVIRMAWENYEAPNNDKYLRHFRVLGRGKFYLQLYKDFEASVSRTFLIDFSVQPDLWATQDVWNLDDWGPHSLIGEQIISPDLYARWLSIVFTDTEDDIGVRPLDVGGVAYNLTSGEWAILGVTQEGAKMGVRD